MGAYNLSEGNIGRSISEAEFMVLGLLEKAAMQDERHFLHLGYFEASSNAIYCSNAGAGHSPSVAQDWRLRHPCRRFSKLDAAFELRHSKNPILLYHNAVHERSSQSVLISQTSEQTPRQRNASR